MAIAVTDKMGLVGEVLLEEYNAEGKLLQRRQANAVSYEMRRRITFRMVGETVTMPTYIAVGAENAAASGTVTSSTSSTLTDSLKSWVTNEWAGYTVTILVGMGAGQFRSITSNTSSALTISPDWTTNPDTTSQYRIEESKDKRTLSKLPRELDRKVIDGARSVTDAARYSTSFQSGEAGGDWSHAMLVDSTAVTAVI